MSELGMPGAAMNCSAFQRSTAETEFDPLCAELNRRGGTLFFQPCASGICSPRIIDYGLSVQRVRRWRTPPWSCASITARRLYYDTVGHGSRASLLCAWKAFGAEHLVPGSDWPVLLAHESYRETMRWIADANLPESDVEQILERSGASLLQTAAP